MTPCEGQCEGGTVGAGCQVVAGSDKHYYAVGTVKFKTVIARSSGKIAVKSLGVDRPTGTSFQRQEFGVENKTVEGPQEGNSQCERRYESINRI